MSERCTEGADELRDREENAMLERHYEEQARRKNAISRIRKALPSLSPEALAVITAVAMGAPISTLNDYVDEGIHFRIYRVDSALADDPCPKCGGSGEIFTKPLPPDKWRGAETIPCDLCHGTGIAP
jgi:hypothetical protein